MVLFPGRQRIGQRGRVHDSGLKCGALLILKKRKRFTSVIENLAPLRLLGGPSVKLV